jgi:uncharacterized protein YndB with AHSA1/START domain
MPVAPEAVLQDQEGRAVLRFERVFQHPPERVWRALTEPGELSAWHPTPFELEPEARTVSYLPEGDVPDMPDGEVTEYEPPRVLGHAWGEDWLRWELRPHDGGCLLVLTYTFEDRFKAARDAAGWDVCLARLSSLLDGAQPEKKEAERQGWRELNSAYERRFGIPPDKATPPPAAADTRSP